jgi:hypothetical protein
MINGLTFEEIQDKFIKLRWLVAWYPGQWYYWDNHAAADELLEEGYVRRTIMYPTQTYWYQATDEGVELYLQWVEWFK